MVILCDLSCCCTTDRVWPVQNNRGEYLPMTATCDGHTHSSFYFYLHCLRAVKKIQISLISCPLFCIHAYTFTVSELLKLTFRLKFIFNS